jgi:hypothetical protein
MGRSFMKMLERGESMRAASGQDGTAQQNSERGNIDPGARYLIN